MSDRRLAPLFSTSPATIALMDGPRMLPPTKISPGQPGPGAPLVRYSLSERLRYPHAAKVPVGDSAAGLEKPLTVKRMSGASRSRAPHERNEAFPVSHRPLTSVKSAPALATQTSAGPRRQKLCKPVWSAY